MLLPSLREQVLEANLELVRQGLVLHTFGNASGVDRDEKLLVIKPSGVSYDKLRPEHMVVTDLDGRVIEGDLRPSSDLDTHSLLYRVFPEIGGVVHTHSEFATAFAQAGLPIPPLGTTHADYFYGPVPVTEPLNDEAIAGRYVHETGLAIVRCYQGRSGWPTATGGGPELDQASTAAIGGNSAETTPGYVQDERRRLDPMAVPACLVAGHAPFVWGRTAADAAHNAAMLETVARLAYRTFSLRAEAAVVSQALLETHYLRKHGAGATYGQVAKQ